MLHRIATWLPLLIVALPMARAQSPESQIDQARQFRSPTAAADLRTGTATEDFPSSETLQAEDDSFGAQQILKRQERPRPFTAFAEVSGFYTNNVALTRRATEQDAFMVASFGMSYRRPIGSRVVVEATVRGALFRYDEFNALDFNSIDAGAGVTWAPEVLRGVALYARYNFTDLISDDSGEEFFQNHTLTLGAQKTYALSRAHSLFAGAAAQLSFADPELAQRDEYSLYGGYHLEATRHLEADLFYRYGYFVYREEGDRKDHNQTLSLALRYNFTDWASVSASTFLGCNISNQEVFDYEVLNGGGGLGLTVRF